MTQLIELKNLRPGDPIPLTADSGCPRHDEVDLIVSNGYTLNADGTVPADGSRQVALARCSHAKEIDDGEQGWVECLAQNRRGIGCCIDQNKDLIHLTCDGKRITPFIEEVRTAYGELRLV